VLVGLTLDTDRVCVQVEDWGVGFTPGEARPGRFGLAGIRRRVEALGGTATIQSQPGRGTCVSVELPRTRHPR
jgi:signal transduction histidine kinase